MPATPLTPSNERDLLHDWLSHGRYMLRLTAYGLTDAQARATPTVSSLSIAGLIAHSAAVERSWMSDFVPDHSDSSGLDDPVAAFDRATVQPLADVIAEYEAASSNTDAIVAGTDLETTIPAGDNILWFGDVDTWSLRWVLQHLIVQTARHTGHADIIREHIDGATAFPLLAAEEQWPVDRDVKPWTAL